MMLAPSSLRRRCLRAFSLMELMLAVGIMGLIVAALYTVFDHTQRALRANVNQTDVLEGGRFAMELLVQDLRGLSAAGQSPETNFLYSLSPAINLAALSPLKPADLLNRYYETNQPKDFSAYLPTVQLLDGGKGYRTNVLEELFIFSRTGVHASGTAYRVINVEGGVGTLARYSFEHDSRIITPGLLSSGALGQLARNYAQLLDGVVHFRVQAFDALGYPMTWTNRDWYAGTNTQANTAYGYRLGQDLQLDPDVRLNTETLAVFRSNALPSSVELEVGVLEPDTLAQFRQLPSGSVFAERFLSNHAGQVQLFRQRVPIWQAPPLQAASQ